MTSLESSLLDMHVAQEHYVGGIFAMEARMEEVFMPRGGATAYRVVCVSVCLLDFLQDGTESAAENCNISITREYLENDGLRFSI